MSRISKTDLILNSDGSIFHLHLHSEEIADNIILVGDPGRVKQVSALFEIVEVVKENREFVTHTGFFNGKRISVISTGIGTDNIDIVLNEIDALVNIDLNKQVIKEDHRKLNLIRIGTCGLLDPDIPPGSIVLSAISGGLDGVLHFYKKSDAIRLPEISGLFMKHFNWNSNLAEPYFVKASESLAELFNTSYVIPGITLSTPGFYGPQFRKLRLDPFTDDFFDRVVKFRYNNMKIANFEMESSALYGLSHALGHEAVTLCVGIANRINLEFVDGYKSYIQQLIEYVLNKLTGDDNVKS